METFTEDMEYFLARVGLSEKLGVEWKHRTHSESSYIFNFLTVFVLMFSILCSLISHHLCNLTLQ